MKDGLPAEACVADYAKGFVGQHCSSYSPLAHRAQADRRSLTE